MQWEKTRETCSGCDNVFIFQMKIAPDSLILREITGFDHAMGFICRKLFGSCPTLQQETSSRSKLWSMLDWFQWSSTNWPRFVWQLYAQSLFILTSPHNTNVMFNAVCNGVEMQRHILSAADRNKNIFWVDLRTKGDSGSWYVGFCWERLCAHLSDRPFLYRGTLALRRRRHGPSVTSPSVGGKTRWVRHQTKTVGGAGRCIQFCLLCGCAGAVPGGTGCHPAFLQPAVSERLPGGAGRPGRLEEYSHHGWRRSQQYCRDHRGVWRSVSAVPFQCRALSSSQFKGC